MHLWRAKYHHHIRQSQAHFCTRLIVVPLTTFRRLSELIGDPQGELIFVFNTGRCGSALLSQVKHYQLFIGYNIVYSGLCECKRAYPL